MLNGLGRIVNAWVALAAPEFETRSVYVAAGALRTAVTLSEAAETNRVDCKIMPGFENVTADDVVKLIPVNVSVTAEP